MNKSVITVLMAVFAILLPLSGHAAPPKGATTDVHHRIDRPGRDAFSRNPVDTTEALVALVKRDAKLRKRYAKHFHVTEDQVIAFISYSLVLKKMPDTRMATTYGVTKTGRIYPVKTKLHKGQMVWATRVGDPVLKWACANPLVAKLPGPKPGKIARLSSPPKKVTKTKVMPLGIKVKAPEEASSLAMVPAPPTLDTVHDLEAAGVGHNTPINMAMIRTPAQSAVAGIPAFHTGHVGLGLPLVLAGLGAVIISQDHDNNGGGGGGNTGGGNTGGGNTGGDTGGDFPPPVAIPETGTFLLVAAVGIPAFLIRLRKR